MSKVAIIPTSPQSVIDDYSKLMDLLNYQEFIKKEINTIIKINLSWSLFYPACSTPPWQLEGVIKKLADDGFNSSNLIPVENQTVVTHPWKGAYLNKWLPILEKYQTDYRPLTNEEWISYDPKGEVPAMRELFKDKIIVPKVYKGANVIHLPTIKCVHPDTEIFLGDGSLQKISQIVEPIHQSKETIVDSDGDAYTKTTIALPSYNGRIRISKTSRLWKTVSPENLIRIYTKTGKDLYVSERHPFLTPSGWRSAKDLFQGSRIAIPRRIGVKGRSQDLPEFSTIREKLEDIDLEDIRFNKGKKSTIDMQKKIIRSYIKGKTSTELANEFNLNPESIRQILIKYDIPVRWIRPPLKTPKKTTEELWEWFGYFLSEGYSSEASGSIRYWFSNIDEIIRGRFIELTKSLFNLTIKVRPNSNDMYFDSNEFYEFLKSLGFSKSIKSHNKFIPRILFKCSDKEISSFIQGYFDGDGGVGKDGLHIVTKSKRLAKDLTMLLLRIGIIGFLKPTESYATNVKSPKKGIYWKVSIYGDEIIRFQDKINLRINKKNVALKRFAERRSRGKRPSNWDTIPVDPSIFRKIRTGLGFSQNSTNKPSSVNAIENGHSMPTRRILDYFIKLFEEKATGKFSEDIQYLKNICNQEIAWDHVESYEKMKSDVPYLYDLSVDDTNCFIGNGTILHNTHGHTVMTGTMKNAFGGLIPKYRHHSHKIIHEVLVDLLTIQKEIHPGLLAVTDGSVSGDGAGPRIMNPVLTNVLLASEDQVANDAVSAKLMGYDPMKIDFIKMAHDQGLGIGDIDQLDIVGMDPDEFKSLDFNFTTKKSLVVKWDQRLRKTTYRYRPLKPFHWFFFYTPFFQLFIMASSVFHDLLWYPLIGKRRIKKFRETTDWGKLFDSYEFGPKLEKFPEIKNWDRY